MLESSGDKGKLSRRASLSLLCPVVSAIPVTPSAQACLSACQREGLRSPWGERTELVLKGHRYGERALHATRGREGGRVKQCEQQIEPKERKRDPKCVLAVRGSVDCELKTSLAILTEYRMRILDPSLSVIAWFNVNSGTLRALWHENGN